MMSYWAQFAYTGAPGRGRDGSLPPWGAWDTSAPQADKYLVLDTQADGGLRMAHETIDPAELLAEVRADAGFASEEERCALVDRLTGWYTSFEDALAEGGSELACAEPVRAASAGEGR
jgi:para-nitrobenzyl esterase